MKKACLKFSPLEYAYQQKYHTMPDMHYSRLREKYGPEVAGRMVNDNVNEVYEEMKNAHQRKIEAEQRQLDLECPF